jgi:hypothetical protein
MKRKSLRRVRPVLELLESRLTPSGNVTATLSQGTLGITGDFQANGITISQPAANQITITPDSTTTVNGKAAALTVKGVTGSVVMSLGAGDDSVTLDLSSGNIDIAGSLVINGTGGNKTINTITGGTKNDLNVGGNLTNLFGNGTENVTLDQFQVRGNMTIDHANGTSFVTLGVDAANLGTLFNNVGGNLNVNNVTSSGVAASGFDIDRLEETNVGGNVINNLGNDDASLGFAGWTTLGSLSSNPVAIGGSVLMSANNGNLSGGDFFCDGFEVGEALVKGAVAINMGSGAGSTATFGGVGPAADTSAASVTITGSGAGDGAFVGTSSIKNNLKVSLSGSGANTIDLEGVAVGGSTSLTSSTGSTAVTIDGGTSAIATMHASPAGSTFGGAVAISTGAGDDSLSINSGVSGLTTAFERSVATSLGAGNDTLTLAETGGVEFFGTATFNGGTGTNTATVNAGNLPNHQPTLVNFS